MTTMNRRDVLIVDDDASLCRTLEAAVNRLGLTSDIAGDGAEALVRIAAAQYSLVLLDLVMPKVDGGEFVTELAKLEAVSPERPIILMMTAFPVNDRPELATRIQAVIPKPFDVIELAELVFDCIETRRLHVAGQERGAARTAFRAVDATLPVRSDEH